MHLFPQFWKKVVQPCSDYIKDDVNYEWKKCTELILQNRVSQRLLIYSLSSSWVSTLVLELHALFHGHTKLPRSRWWTASPIPGCWVDPRHKCESKKRRQHFNEKMSHCRCPVLSAPVCESKRLNQSRRRWQGNSLWRPAEAAATSPGDAAVLWETEWSWWRCL